MTWTLSSNDANRFYSDPCARIHRHYDFTFLPKDLYPVATVRPIPDQKCVFVVSQPYLYVCSIACFFSSLFLKKCVMSESLKHSCVLKD
jgi:hypothetical protein